MTAALGRDAGWASRSLYLALRQTLLLQIAAWQAVMIWAVWSTSAPPLTLAALTAAHVALAALALLKSIRRFPPIVLVASVYAVALADMWVDGSLDGTLTFAACWLTNFMACATMVLMWRRRAPVVTSIVAVVVPIALHLLNPQWNGGPSFAIFVGTVFIGLVLGFGMPVLFAVARRIDANTQRAAADIRRAEVIRRRTTELTEDGRVLHDTAINTLAAIASGGAAARDVTLVRARCAADAAVIEQLRTDRRRLGDDHLIDLFDQADAEITRSGIDDAALREAEATLTPGRRQALVRATHEVVQNVVKHAQVTEARIDVRVEDDDLVITVTDAGIGFDGTLPPGRGMQTSVMDRAVTAGFDVTVRTRPGVGTSVSLRAPLSSGVADPPDLAAAVVDEPGIDHAIGAMLRRTGWLWSAGIAASGVPLAVLNRAGHATAVYPLIALLVASTALAWRMRRPEGFGTAVHVMLMSTMAACFWLSGAAVDFGATDPIYWQAFAPTGAWVLVIASRPRRRVLAWSLTVYVLTVATVMAFLWHVEVGSATITAMAGSAGIVLGLGWLTFQRRVLAIAAEAAEDDRDALRAQLETTDLVASDEARRWWEAAGLATMEPLLNDIASGAADPADPGVRAACAREEASLRQLVRLDSGLVHLGRWLLQAMNAARGRGVTVHLHTGSADAPDAQTAREAGELLLQSIRSVPTGSHVHVSVFQTSHGVELHLVTPVSASSSDSTTTGLVQLRSEVGGQEVIRIPLTPSNPADNDA